MLEYVKKLNGDAHQNVLLIDFKSLLGLTNYIKKLESVKSVALDDEATLIIKLKKAINGNCLLKNLGNGKLVLVTYWNIPAKERIVYYVATTLWNDNKRGSHLTCSYITTEQLCVMESHLNIDWGVTNNYFSKWLENYVSSISLFTEHVEKNQRAY